MYVYMDLCVAAYMYTPILGRVISNCSFDPFPHNTPDNLMFLYYFILCMHLVILSLYAAVNFKLLHSQTIKGLSYLISSYQKVHFPF